jgi:LmbE family N-acetylglucosaminyl deacetylase
LAGIRQQEVTNACRLIGAEPLFAGIEDGHAADTPQQRRKLIRIYRRFRPTLVLAHAANDYHADHRAAAALAEAASWFACSAAHRTTGRALGKPPAVWWMDTVNMTGFVPDFYVDISDFLPLKRKMLACHESQLRRGTDSDFGPLEELMFRQSATRGAQADVAAAEAFQVHRAWKRLGAW